MVSLLITTATISTCITVQGRSVVRESGQVPSSKEKAAVAQGTQFANFNAIGVSGKEILGPKTD